MNLDQVIKTAEALAQELRVMPQRRKPMTPEELDIKLGNLATVAQNLTDELKVIRQKADELKEY